MINRIYSDEMEFDSDLFKLDVAFMLKNAGYDDNNPILQNLEHCHFYRTFDSNGKNNSRCNFVAGHTHEVTLTVDKEGEFKAKCSPAIGAKFNDSHVHKITYIKSDKIKKRKMSPEAQQFIAKFQSA